MLETTFYVSQGRPRYARSNSLGGSVAARSAPTTEAKLTARKKPAARRQRRRQAAPRVPEGWNARLREQSHNLASATAMLEQALGMLNEPRTLPLARAQCLRGAALIALVAASELLTVAGWYEAENTVVGGTRDV
jgi:hypothetical protein